MDVDLNVDAPETVNPNSGCFSTICHTCSDEAWPAVVIELTAEGMARVDDGSGIRDIYIQLVEAVAGDTVLVHADVAIGKLVPQA